MRAAVYRQYGPPEVVRVESLPDPAPADDQLLIRVRAATVSSGDARVRSLTVPPGFGPFARPAFGITGPRKPILGTELAGEVVAVGRSVAQFKVGDRVFAFPGMDMGAHAELRAMPASGRVALIPDDLSFEQAAALCFGGSTALHFLRDLARLQPGQHLLILGASGAVGSAAVQIARHLGARVSATSSAANLDLVRSLGADHVIDYNATPLSALPDRYDVILDAVGAASNAQGLAALKPGGALLLCAAGVGQLLGAAWRSFTGPHRLLGGPASERLEHLHTLAALAASGQYTPVIDQTFPLDDIAAAHARVDAGRKRGSVVVVM